MRAEPPIVGLCVTAGGLQALLAFLAALPESPGAAFVLAVYLDALTPEDIAAILATRTAMPVVPVQAATPMARDHIYLVVHKRQLRIADAHIAAPPHDEGPSPDGFFRALAASRRAAAIVLLAGAAAEGALGARAVREAGGIVLAQHPHEADQADMPHSAIAAGAVDAVLPVRALAAHLVALLQRGDAEPQAPSHDHGVPSSRARSSSGNPQTNAKEPGPTDAALRIANRGLQGRLDTVARANSDLQNLMAATDVGTLFLDRSLRIARFSVNLAALLHLTDQDCGRIITDFATLPLFADMAARVRTVLQEGSPIECEVADSEGGLYLVTMRPYRTLEGKIDGAVITFVDIGERRRVESALRESEARLRQEMRLVELSRAPIFVWQSDDRITQWNRGSEELYGYSREEAVGQRKQALLRTRVPGSSPEMLRRHLARHGSWSGELIHFAKDGREIIVESQIEMLAVGDRQVVLESTRDITDRRRWEERQCLLLNESTHRIKNILAVVQSLARLTLRGAASPAAFVAGFEGRLAALANAHTLLVNSHWQGAELGELVRTQLEAYQDGAGRRFRLEGPPVMLTAELATPFGLIIHELATNAVKYGAWSSARGHVRLCWKTIEQNGELRLHFVWRECDGPDVTATDRRGSGTTLIQNSLPGAEVRQEYLRDGLICTIDQPLDWEEHDGGDT